MRENYSNFATTALSGALSSSSTSFNVTTSQGALFPSSNFYVVVDSEIMLISTRSVDNFTIQTRGVDGTLAASHVLGVTVQCDWTRYGVYHLWQNVADTYHPEVPPLQLLPAGSPSVYDNEFESTGNWLYAPNPASGTTFSTGLVTSHLLLSRGTNDNATYTAYIPFAVSSSAFTVTCKLCDGTSFLHTSTGDQAQCQLFVSDQSNPSSGADTGTRFRVDTVSTVNVSTTSSFPTRWVRGAIDTTGSYSQVGPTVPLDLGVPTFLRITCDGAGNWASFFGDGYVYWQLAAKSNFLTAPQSLGITFYNYTPSTQWMQATALVDYVRVVVGTVLPPYAN